MQKKIIFSLILLASSTIFATAQNLQLHFDPRHSIHGDHFSRNYFTATFEMFKADKWGSTFMFVDLDFSQKKGDIGLAYTEVMRDQKIGSLPVLAHIEYNGGLLKGGSIPNAYLVGASYPMQFGTFNLNTYLVYKYNSFERASHDAQWTVTWGGNICNNKITLSGFFDVWTENKRTTKAEDLSGKKIVLLTEPQIWYNVTENLSLGSEIEISSNFGFSEKTFKKNRAYVNPTLAAKWNF